MGKSGGGGGKGGGGSVTAPTISVPPGLLQSLNSVQGIGGFGQSTFNPLSSLGNWAAGIATGGNNIGIGSSQEQGLQAGPTVNIGTGGPTGHDSWTTAFNPQTGQITFTNAQTGGTFDEWFGSSQAQQYVPPATLAEWGQLYNNRGQGAISGPGGPVTSQNWFQQLGPSLQTAWDQIQSIGGIEGETRGFNKQANSLINQDLSLIAPELAQANAEQAQANQLFSEATTGLGVTPSQAAWINQGVTSEQTELSQQLAAEGLGNSTANAILRGEAAQQGAVTAGQLQQGNISLAQQQQSLAHQATAIVQNQQQIVQGAQKLALAGQTLSLGEASAMAGLAQGFQAQTWGEAVQAYQTLGQMMSTTGALYGIDVTGYSNVLQAAIAQGQLSLEAAMGNAQAAIGGMQSLGSGLGAIFGQGGLSGLLGGGAFGGGGGTALGALGGAGGLGPALSGTGSASLAGGAAGGGGLFSGLFSGLGSVGSGILSGIGALFAAL